MSKNAKKSTNTKKAAPGAKKTPNAKGRAKATPARESAPTATPVATEPDAKKTEGKLSGLDAAAKVLADAGTPLGAGELIERMLSQGLWKTEGKTPAATIYAAIAREIKVKGAQARFKKTERGRFAVA